MNSRCGCPAKEPAEPYVRLNSLCLQTKLDFDFDENCWFLIQSENATGWTSKKVPVIPSDTVSFCIKNGKLWRLHWSIDSQGWEWLESDNCDSKKYAIPPAVLSSSPDSDQADDGDADSASDQVIERKIVNSMTWKYIPDDSGGWLWYCEDTGQGQLHEPMDMAELAEEKDDPNIEPPPIFFKKLRLTAEWEYDEACWIYNAVGIKLKRIAAGIPPRRLPDIRIEEGKEYAPHWSVDHNRLCWVSNESGEWLLDEPVENSHEGGNAADHVRQIDKSPGKSLDEASKSENSNSTGDKDGMLQLTVAAASTLEKSIDSMVTATPFSRDELPGVIADAALQNQHERNPVEADSVDHVMTLAVTHEGENGKDGHMKKTHFHEEVFKWQTDNRLPSSIMESLLAIAIANNPCPDTEIYYMDDLKCMTKIDLNAISEQLKPLEFKRLTRSLGLEASSPREVSSARGPTPPAATPMAPSTPTLRSATTRSDFETKTAFNTDFSDSDEPLAIAGEHAGELPVSTREACMSLAELEMHRDEVTKALGQVNGVLCQEVIGVSKEKGDVTAYAKDRLERSKQGHLEHLRRLKALISTIKKEAAAGSAAALSNQPPQPPSELSAHQLSRHPRTGVKRLHLLIPMGGVCITTVKGKAAPHKGGTTKEITVAYKGRSPEQIAKDQLLQLEEAQRQRMEAIRKNHEEQEKKRLAAARAAAVGPAKPPPPGSTWACTYCTAHNAFGVRICSACNQLKFEAPPPVLRGPLWTCPYCNVKNSVDAVKCSGCRQDKYVEKKSYFTVGTYDSSGYGYGYGGGGSYGGVGYGGGGHRGGGGGYHGGKGGKKKK